ncbi:MAG: ABC transporter ATP-binding protein [Rikenellaceae bacterium]
MRLSENIRWIYNTSRGVRAGISLFIVLGFASVFSSLLFIWLTKSLIDMATHGAEVSSIRLYIIFLAAAIIFQQVIVVVRGRISNRTSTKLMNRLRLELFETVMRSQWSGKELRHTGDIVNRIESDSRTVSEALCITIPSIFITLVQFLASFRFLHILDARLSWVIVAIMPIALIVSKRYLFTMRKLTQAIRSTDSAVQSHIQEQIQNRTVINTVGDVGGSVQTLQGWSNTLLEQTMRRVNYTLFSRTTVQLGFGVGYIVALSWGIFGLQSGAVSFGVLTAFLQLVAQIQRPSVELATQISQTAQCTASIDRLEDIFEMKAEENSSQQRVLSGELGIEAKDLDFEYADGAGRKILSAFNYNFSPNRLHVIIGHTGVGKSTLVRLMLGLLKPNRGSINIYNNSAESVECSAATRQNFVYVPQGNTLMSGTIRQNLLLAKPSATEEELREALHTAAADFAWELPQRLETICTERGAGLSEGEAQRIAIARGLLQDGGVILLDEPTSALDSNTEELLMSRLTKYAQNRTLIVVTHRLASAQHCASVIKMG